MKTNSFIHRSRSGLRMAACLAVLLAAGIGCRTQEIKKRQAGRLEYMRHSFDNFRVLEKDRPAQIQKVFAEAEALQRDRNIRLENRPILTELVSMHAGIAKMGN